jgi:sugar lactone lactonase YvrE
MITDIAFDDEGNLYVVQFPGETSPGALIRVTPDGDREELAAGKLTTPYGIALHGDHAYVTQNATEVGTGEVVRITVDGDGGDDDD